MPRVPSEAAAHLGRIIRAKRAERDLTQEQLGHLSDVGSSNIRSYENGHALPNLFTTVRIAEALETPIGELLDGLKLEMFPDHKNRGRK